MLVDKRKKHGVFPIDTYFIDSGPMIGQYMSLTESGKGLQFRENLSFLGKSGIKVLKNGLRVAYVSGVEADFLDSIVKNIDPKEVSKGHQFLRQDMERVIK